MSLDNHSIIKSSSDEELFRELSSELQRRLPVELCCDYDLYVPALRALPRGLRAMAAIHQLSVSMAMDDLGWHFYNFHDRGFCDETQWGLRELEALESAQIFEAARALVEPHWDEITSLRAIGHKAFADWYTGSELDVQLGPLNSRLWSICNQSWEYGLLQVWLNYARKYPDRLTEGQLAL